VPLWRALTVYRIATLAYAVALMGTQGATYPHPGWGWTVMAVMTLWTLAAALLYADPRHRAWPLLLTDLVVTLACVIPTKWVVPPENLSHGASSLPMAWAAGPVLAWAISGGMRRGAVAALFVGLADLTIRGGINPVTANATALLLLAGVVVGYVVRLGLDAEAQLRRATEMQAATRERERLARGIHDSVLQVLALIERRGSELGGEAATLGRLAGQQGSNLRSLVGMGTGLGTGSGTGLGAATAGAGGEIDLREVLGSLVSELSGSPQVVSMAFPASPVPLRDEVAVEVSRAVAAALDNVRVHCGPATRAWVLVEDEGAQVLVTVRDEGPGIAEGRLAQAADEGRLGVAQSIYGRMRDLAGSAAIVSTPEGTEVELRVPR
jgi:signal transduction histidine kinase